MERTYELMEKVETLLNEHHLYPEVSHMGTMIVVSIEWGDWKHDHLYAKALITENLPLISFKSIVTEDDGSDCYSAKHYFTERN